MSRYAPTSAMLLAFACAPGPVVPVVRTSEMEPRVAEHIERARASASALTASADAWGDYAQVLHAHHELTAALVAYEHAGRLAPEEPRWAYGRACAAQEARLPLEDLDPLFAAARTLLPDHAPLYCRLGRARLEAGDASGATDAYREALARDPALALAHRGLGHGLLALGDAQGASEHLLRAAELLPADAAAWAGLARAWRLLGEDARADEATAAAGRGTVLDRLPDELREEVGLRAVSSGALLARADRALAAGELAGSIDLLEQATEARPDDPWIWRNLALARRRAGRSASAREAAERALQLSPDFGLGHLELGKIEELDGHPDEALKHYLRVIELDPEAETGWARLAVSLAKAGRAAEGLGVFRAADARMALGAETLADWGTTCLLIGEAAEAESVFERALDLAPELQRARAGLERARTGSD